jgi:Bacterial Ig domain/Purple acid Phosphatase, N-terminal domain
MLHRSRRFSAWLATAFALGVLYPTGSAIPAFAAGPCGPPVVNPVACENTNPGNPQPEWDVNGSGDPSLQGFATDISVNKGSTISFKINTTASSYSIGIFRFGYYQGNGARKIATLTPSAKLPQSQPTCMTNAPTGLVDCGNWAVSASWSVPTTAVSGVYMAVLVRPDTGGASQIPFVVRDDSSHSDILFQTDDTTWEAYNQYGGNSLYLGSAPTSDGRAYKVSYNRPFADRSQGGGYGTSNFFFYAEYPMIRFLEANGYDVSYQSGVDADRNGSLIKNHKTLVTAGHDEYWSGGMRANVQGARDSGVNIAFFTGNEVFWKTRFENSIDGSGTSYRTLVCYKETKSTTPLDPLDPPIWTGTWRDPTLSPPADGGRPENALNGTIFMVNRGSAAIQVPAAYSKLRLWRNTSVATLGSGQTATFGTETIGYEWDEDLDNGFRPPGLFDLSSTTVSVPELLQDYGNTYSPGTAVHHLTFYKAASGAQVFAAGTVQWAWGLDTNHDTNPDTGPATVDVRMQQATINLLGDMGDQPATIIAGMVAATPSTDATPPTSTITSPSAGSSFAPGSTTTISGTASDTGGGVVAGVEVSVDGGSTWHPATGTGSWTYTWKPLRAGSATIRSRAVDDSGNLETPTAGTGVTITGSTAQPLFIAKSTATNSPTVVAPAGAVQGDVMVAVMEVDADPVTVTGPTGWTLADNTTAANGQGSSFHVQVWYKVAGATEPGSYTWSVPGNPWIDVGVLDYAYVNTTSPIDTIAGRDAGTTAAPTTPAISTTQANDLVLAGFIDYNTVSFTAGSGMTQRYNFDSNTIQDAAQAVAGSTGSKTATSSGSGPTGAIILALKPGSTDTTPPTVAVTAPVNGSVVSGTVTLSANASDNVGVASVQFQVDGASVGSKLTSVPYSLSWNSTTVTNGTHTISAAAADAAGNQTTSSPITVTVNNVPPVISTVLAGGLTTSSAAVSWSTDVAANSQVDYGTSTAYGSSTTLDSTLVIGHAQTLSGLLPATVYHYRVKSANSNGSLGTSGDFTFTTATPAPPVISNVLSSGVTSSGATISWTSDTATDTTVQYGITAAYGATASTAGLVTSHSQVLSGLIASNTYHYQVQSKDAYGQTTSSTDFTFTTVGPPPAISNVQASGLTTNSAAIGWTTDVAATSQVDYGTSTAYGNSTALDSTLVTSHSQTLGGLMPATAYHYRVKSANSSGSLATSGDFTFTTATPAPPVISNVQTNSITGSGATVTWSTDTAADTTVQYGPTTSYGSTASTGGLATTHSQLLTGLTPSTTYHYKVSSKDAYNQVSSSGDVTFTTAATLPTAPGFRSQSSMTNGTTIAKPGGAVSGDLLLATLEVDADPVTVTGPSGWTLLLDTVAARGTGSAFHAQVWYKVATASEPATYTWSVPGGTWVDMGVLDYSGVNTSSPIDASNGTYDGSVSNASTNAITTTQANDLVVVLFIDFEFATWTPGSGTTKRYDFDGNTAEDLVQGSVGSTGAKSATASATGPISAQIVALKGK